nr:hypothetical protein [Tanacetum cinerariifolium]
MISSVTNALASFMGTVLMLVTISQHKFLLSKLCRVFHSNILVVKIVRLLMNLTSVNQRIMTIIISKILAMILILLVLTIVNPPQYTVNHHIFNAHNAFLDSQNKLTITQNKIIEQMTQLTSMCEMACQIIQKKQEEKRPEEEQAAKAQNSKIPVCCDDDDDYFAITPSEPIDSLSMGDEHLDTVLETKSDELIKSGVENLVPNPSESQGEKIDSLLDEFARELTLLKSIPPGFDETDCYPKDEIRFTERLLYDNSSSRPPEQFFSENSNAEIESLSPSPIPVEDSDSRMEEIDLFLTPDDLVPPSIEDDDNDSEKDILILQELPSNYSLSLPESESFYFDIPSFSHPPAKPPDGSTGILNIKMMGDVSDQKVPIPGLTITRVPNQEKSPDLLSHQGFEIFQPSAKYPMIFYEKNILDVPLFYFYPLDQFKYGGNWVKLSDLNKRFVGGTPCLSVV